MINSYWIILIMIIALAAAVTGMILRRLKKPKAVANIFFSIAFTIWWSIFYLFIIFMAAIFSGLNGIFWEIVAFTAGGLIWLVVMLALWGVLKRKPVWLSCVGLAAVLVLTVGGHLGYQAYIDSIPTLDENADLLPAYAPWQENTKAVTLSEPATLQLTDDLPRMDGATALFPVYSSFAKAVYPKEALDHWDPYTSEGALVCTKTNGAYDALITGVADIIFVSGPSKQQEAWAKDMNVELVYTPIGKEGFVFFVNARNPLENITIEQIKGIYSGEITRWKDLDIAGLGGIRAFQRPENSGSQTRLQKLMGDTPLMSPPSKDVVSGMGGIIRETADYKNHKNAIGYSFRFYATEMAANDEIKLLNIEGIAPTEENIANDTYPLTGTFYAVTRKDAGEKVARLLEWIKGPQGQEIIAAVGYTPLYS